MDNPLKVLLVDDEPPARRWLRTLLNAHAGITLVGEAATVSEAISLWKTAQPDVIFLDIQMPPESGFDLLPHLQPQPRIIFVTAHDTYAVRAFEANALDYLLKPVRPERLAETLRRLYPTPPPPPSPAPSCTLQPEDFIPLRADGLHRIVQVREIALIEAEGAYTRVHLRRHPPMLILRRLGEWADRLPSALFPRIDRSTITNLSLIRKIERISRDQTTVTIEGAGTLSLHRIASQRLRSLLSMQEKEGAREDLQCVSVTGYPLDM